MEHKLKNQILDVVVEQRVVEYRCLRAKNFQPQVAQLSLVLLRIQARTRGTQIRDF